MALSHPVPRKLRTIGFPAAPLKRLASPRTHTPWHVIQNERCTPEGAHLSITIRFHALVTLCEEYFSAFPHGTGFAIGLATYLGLEVTDPQVHASVPRHATQDTSKPSHPSPTGLSPSMALRSRRPRLGKGRSEGRPTTPHAVRFSARDSVCPMLRSLAATYSIPIGFFSYRY